MTRDEETRQMNQEVIAHKEEIQGVLTALYASLDNLRQFSNTLLQDADINIRIRTLMPHVKDFLEFQKFNGEEMMVLATILSDWAVKRLRQGVDAIIQNPNELCMCAECVKVRHEGNGVAVVGVPLPSCRTLTHSAHI